VAAAPRREAAAVCVFAHRAPSLRSVRSYLSFQAMLTAAGYLPECRGCRESLRRLERFLVHAEWLTGVRRRTRRGICRRTRRPPHASG